MSLSESWFRQSRERNKQREIHGVSIDEISGALARYSNSSVRPIATEMAEWLYKNWTTEQIFQLPYLLRLKFFGIVEKEIIPIKSPDPEDD